MNYKVSFPFVNGIANERNLMQRNIKKTSRVLQAQFLAFTGVAVTAHCDAGSRVTFACISVYQCERCIYAWGWKARATLLRAASRTFTCTRAPTKFMIIPRLCICHSYVLSPPSISIFLYASYFKKRRREYFFNPFNPSISTSNSDYDVTYVWALSVSKVLSPIQ